MSSPQLAALLVTLLFFFSGTFALTTLVHALRRLHKKESIEALEGLGNRFFYRKIQLFFLPKNAYEKIFFSAICAQNFARFSLGALSILFLLQWSLTPLELSLLFVLSAFLFFFLTDYYARILGINHPKQSLKGFGFLSSLFLLFAFPITYSYLKLTEWFSSSLYFDALHLPEERVKQELIEVIHAAKIGPRSDVQEKKLLKSALQFRKRVVREVMVPRVDLFCLEAKTPIKKAASLLQKEGYSRIPVYQESIDNVVGVLMYKDLLSCYLEKETEKKINETIETLMKPVLYTPETKNISHLLQEFRKKQVHLAIVVDEYGGTEGVVSIEDILEEIVGEIADEYDEEETLFVKNADGSWKIDARMSIIDTEKELGIAIPQEGDYDTIGGYVFYLTGTIPPKGFVVDHDAFVMKVLSSNERCVESVHIWPRKKSSS